MALDMTLVKKLREQTGIGILECRKALEEVGNDYEKAVDLLRKKGFEKAKSKMDRAVNQGVIGSYVHNNNRVGVLVEVRCETDFVARTDDFLQLVKDIALQITAMNPRYVSESDVPAEVLEKEREIYREQMKESGKPANIVEKIIEGKLSKFYAEACLMNQTFFKDEKLTMEKLIAEKIHKTGENIQIKRFVRFQLGDEQ